MQPTTELAEGLISSLADTFYTRIALGTAKRDRKQSGVPLVRLAEELNVRPRAVLRWESGQRSPNRWDAYRYMKALNDLQARDGMNGQQHSRA